MKLIPLTQGQFAQVDDELFEELNQYKWQAKCSHKIWYAARAIIFEGKYKSILMHRQIMNITDRKTLIDHKDHNGLNNQKKNLRICDIHQNCANRRGMGKSKYLGVMLTVPKPNQKPYLRWVARIVYKGKATHLGVFPYTKEGEIQAAKAYDEAAKKYHKEYANLNFK